MIEALRRQRGWVIGGLALIAMGVIAVLLWPRREDRAWERIQESGVIVFATDATYYPFEVIDANGAYFGFDIELGQALAGQLGAEARFDLVGYDGLIGSLTVYRTDAVLSAFVQDNTRLNEAAYTTPYFNAGVMLVLPAASEPVTSADALRWAAGKTLAVTYGAQGDVIARQWARRAVGVSTVPMPDDASAMQVVIDGNADAALVEGVAAFEFTQQHPELQISAAVDDVPYVLAVHHRHRDTLAALNQALADLERSGALGDLRVKWFGEAARTMPWAGR